MRRNIWSRKTGPAPGRSSTRLWTACLGFGCAGGDSPSLPRYLSGYCAVGQIHQAASVGAVDTVERFLTNGVNGVNDTDKKNRTALHYACAHGQLGVVTLLIEWNCDINACDDDNCTPLIKASQHQHEECVVLLLQQGAEANAVDARGNTALHYAVHNENTAIASQLLEHGANIEAKTKDGFTPLLLALQQNKDQIVELLIEKGANIHTMFHRTADQYPRDRKTQCVKSPHGTLQDEVALRTITLWQKTFQTRKTNLPHGHQQKTSHKQKGKKKCDTGHTHAHSGCLTMETDKEAQQREQLNKVLKTKFQTSSESFEKTPPLGIFKAEEERNYGLQEPAVTLESSNDRTACAVASVGGDAASGSTSTSAASNVISASTSNASAAAAPASAALAAAAVVDFSNATVNAAVAAVTATTDHKGTEPILQRHSGTISKKDFALAGKEEHNKTFDSFFCEAGTLKDHPIMFWSPLKQNKKRVNDGCFYGKLKTEFRGGERQYHEEFGRQLWSSLYHQCYNEEFSQHEMFLEDLNMNSKALKNIVTQEAQLQEERQREGILNSSRVEYQLWKLQVECFKLEDSVKNQAEEIEEIENQLLREDLIGNKKKQQNKLIQSTQSLACALDQEKEKTEELEKELHGFMEVLKVIRKKLNECENRELHFYEDMKSRTFEMLRHEINYLKETWGPIHCRYLQQDINIQLTEQELLKIKTDQDNYGHTHKTQQNVEKEILTLKSLIKETMTQTEEEKKLEKLRENNNGSRMSQMVLRIKNLESKLPEIKNQVDSTRREMEKCKQLYAEEIKTRKSLSNTLRKTMGRLEVSTTKLMWANQQKITLGMVLSSLPVQKFPHVAKANPAVGHSPSFPLRDASFLLTLEPQPVYESVRKDLSKRRMRLVKHIAREAEEVSAPLDSWSFEASPLRPTDTSSYNLSQEE